MPVKSLPAIVMAVSLLTSTGVPQIEVSIQQLMSRDQFQRFLQDCPSDGQESTLSVNRIRGDYHHEGVGAQVGTVSIPQCTPDTAEPAPNPTPVASNLSGDSGTSPTDDTTSFIPEPISVGPGQCQWHYVNPPPGDPSWEGNDPSTGQVLENNCDGPVRSIFMPGPSPTAALAPTPPPPSPQDLAEQAYRELVVSEPSIGVGPNRTKLAVNLWTWLWVDDPGPQTITVAAGGISVTVTATLSSVTWSLGEPAATGGPYADGPPVTLTCQGTGTPPPANYDWKAEPPCGHMYTWRSTKERTNGTGTWPITATSNWTVTWQSNTGVTGGTTLSATSNDALEIGEYRTVLVEGPGG